MKFPYTILSDLSYEEKALWDSFYKPSILSDCVRTTEEGLWRRSQTYQNKDESLWKSREDSRRRICIYKTNQEKRSVRHEKDRNQAV